MNLWSCVELGFKEMWANPVRSALTMLGVVLGVASLVAMSALVKGMEKGAREALVAVGGLQKIRIEASDVPVYQFHLKDQAPGITLADVEALRRSAPLVDVVSPGMRLFGATLSAHNKTFRPFTCTGVWPVAVEMTEHVLAHGRMFNEIDDAEARSVCVIGTATRDELFGAPEDLGYEVIPIGETVYINRQPFTIIGMFQHYESEKQRAERELARTQPQQVSTGPARSRGWGGRRGGGGNFVFWLKNATVYIPLNTMWIKFRAGAVSGGGGWGGSSASAAAQLAYPDPRLSDLEVRIKDVGLMNEALQQMRNVLLSTHRGIEDFSFRTQEDWADDIQQFVRNTRASGGFIAGISLIVGGVGIMNIMLASISARIREIGIRKSIGANTTDIFTQVLVESVVLALLGGLAGLAGGILFVHLLRDLTPTDNAPIITLFALGGAFGASVCIGILAGLIPALKAARLDPLEALRYE